MEGPWDDEWPIKLAIAEYLAKPKPKRITIADHGPWDFANRRCLGCGRTELQLYSTTKMPKCGTVQGETHDHE